MGSNAKRSEGIGRIFTGSPEYVEYIVLPDDRVEEALALQEDTSRRENINAGFGLHDKATSVAELNSICREIIKDRCTVVALDTRTDQIVGVCFNKIHVVRKNGELDSLEEFVKNNIREEASLGVMDFIASVESRVNLFRHYNAHCLLELFYAGTDSRYSNCGIGRNLVKASIELGRGLGKLKNRKIPADEAMGPEVVFGIFTSNFSQRIASRLNFEWLATIPYDEYLYRGKKLSERIDEDHKTARLGALRITLSEPIIRSY